MEVITNSFTDIYLTIMTLGSVFIMMYAVALMISLKGKKPDENKK